DLEEVDQLVSDLPEEVKHQANTGPLKEEIAKIQEELNRSTTLRVREESQHKKETRPYLDEPTDIEAKASGVSAKVSDLKTKVEGALRSARETDETHLRIANWAIYIITLV